MAGILAKEYYFGFLFVPKNQGKRFSKRQVFVDRLHNIVRIAKKSGICEDKASNFKVYNIHWQMWAVTKCTSLDDQISSDKFGFEVPYLDSRGRLKKLTLYATSEASRKKWMAYVQYTIELSRTEPE
eukprot:TRINITY_DN4517_c0_g1_i1.p1 TRINITY_DN4517_c0_g1~~TRINITY_DN4517_c0_g1_i1.p1  ORF type:complete len:137 (-),score=22.96 TRINITY_DN4517_c0_g1_i1:92-472(-)